MTFLIDADIDGLEDMKLIYGIIAVEEKVRPGKDVKVYFSLNLFDFITITIFLDIKNCNPCRYFGFII